MSKANIHVKNRSTGRGTSEILEAMLTTYAEANAELEAKLRNNAEEATEYERAIGIANLQKIDFAFRFYNLSSIAVDIIMLIHKCGGTFRGNYSELTRALGREDGAKGHTPNIRNMCLRLKEQGIITIHCHKGAGGNGRPEAISLSPNWMGII